MTSKSIQPFAFRIGRPWVVFNSSHDWSAVGETGFRWLTLSFVHVPSGKGEAQRHFRIGWNGKSLARCKELARLEQLFPGASATLQAVLETRVPAPKEIDR